MENTIQPVSVSSITDAQLRESLNVVSKVKDPKRVGELSDLSRVNEQDMFAAITHAQIEKIDPKEATIFEAKFSELFVELNKKDPSNAVFETTRRVLKGMRRTGEISKELFKKIRLFSLGKAQLDSKRDELATKNVTGKKGDTALRAVKTALGKFASNVEATVEELSNFKNHNGARRAEARAALNETPLESTDSST